MGGSKKNLKKLSNQPGVLLIFLCAQFQITKYGSYYCDCNYLELRFKMIIDTIPKSPFTISHYKACVLSHETDYIYSSFFFCSRMIKPN